MKIAHIAQKVIVDELTEEHTLSLCCLVCVGHARRQDFKVPNFDLHSTSSVDRAKLFLLATQVAAFRTRHARCGR